MRLVSAQVGPYKSIDGQQTVEIQPNTTVLVGMNEAGKTVFLEALQKSDDVLGNAKFSPVEDYPRKDLTAYLKRHKASPETVTTLVYQLADPEVLVLNKQLNTNVTKTFQFSVSRTYANNLSVNVKVDEKPVIAALASSAELSTDMRNAVKSAAWVRDIPKESEAVDKTEADKKFLKSVSDRIAKSEWVSVVQWEAWQWLAARTPKFMYFGDYDILPSKTNLAQLKQAAANPATLHREQMEVLALLRMADISIDEFTDPGGVEPLIAKIEAVSISLTDQIMEFWKQNELLKVKIEIRPDPNDAPPFNNGPNLYIRIANERHRGVTTPFRQRSRGFIWFFSFLVWFDSVQHQLEVSKDKDRPLILLLDEPGLNLHALAQRDFLRYIDDLAKRHQVVYSTHSPFMIHSDRLQDVRVVEDRDKVGTVISANVMDTDRRTSFPLQAALGWTLAQNLFVSQRNLLVEGPADLIFLQHVSHILEAAGRRHLRDDVTVVPTGGLDKVVTFIALLGGNGLEMAVLHDFRGKPEQKLIDMVRHRIINTNAVMDASQFRNLANLGNSGQPTDLEDLLAPSLYLRYFNRAYAKELGSNVIQEIDLAAGDRIIERIEKLLVTRSITLRPSGGFNHYAPAREFASSPPATLDADTLARFEALFNAVNALFT